MQPLPQKRPLQSCMTSAHVTASSEHILILPSQGVSSLGTQAHQLSFYSDSKMSYTGLDISASQTSTLETPCDYFSFHCWQFGSVTMKVQPSLSNVGSFIAIHRHYPCLALTTLTISENVTMQVRDFSPLPSRLNLAFRVSLLNLPPVTGLTRTKFLSCILSRFSILIHLIENKIVSRLDVFLWFWERQRLLQSWMWWEGFCGGW